MEMFLRASPFAPVGSEALKGGGGLGQPQPHQLALVARGGVPQGGGTHGGAAAEERLAVRSSTPGPAVRDVFPSPTTACLSVCMHPDPAPRPQGLQTWRVAPSCLAAWPISARPAAPVSGQRSQRLLALRVCLELPCPPSVSLDSPALSWLISGSCCCRQRK